MILDIDHIAISSSDFFNDVEIFSKLDYELEFAIVIGKRGKNVTALRTLLTAATAKEGGKRAILEVIE